MEKLNVRNIFIKILILFFSSAVHSEELLAALSDAKQNDPQWLGAKSKYEQSDEIKIQARAILLPNLLYTKSKNNTSQIITQPGSNQSEQKYPSEVSAITIKQPVIRVQDFMGINLADKKVNRALIELGHEEQQLAARLISNYLDVINSNILYNSEKLNNRWANSYLNLVRAKYKVGQASELEEVFAIANTEKAVAQEQQAAEMLALATNQLAYQTGVVRHPIKRFEGFDSKFFDLKNYDQLVDDAIEFSPLILMSKADIEIAKASLRQAEAAHLPTLDFVAQMSQSTADNAYYYAQKGSYKTENKTAGILLSVPIYTGGVADSKIRLSLKELEQAEYKYSETMNRIKLQVQSEFNTIKIGLLVVRASQSAYNAAKLSAESSSLSASVGYKSEVDKLKSAAEKEQALVKLSQAKAEVIKSWFRLNAILGKIDEKMIVTYSRML